MANGPGVSVAQVDGGKWRVRWRETVEEGGVTRRVQRERVVQDERTAIDLRARVLRAIETGTVYEEEVREVVRVATLDAVLGGWLKAKAARGVARNTIESYGGRVARILRTYRAMRRLPETSPVPGEVLTREGVVSLTLRLHEDKLSEGTVHGTIQSLVAAWMWASDDPETFPGVAPAPRDPSALLPRPPVYAAAPAPTMAECDAVLRVLAQTPRAKIAMGVAVIARSTGLRAGQVLGIRVGDVDLGRMTLVVRTGKSRREKAERREVPIAPVLSDFLRALVQGSAPGDQLLQRRSDASGSRGGPDRTLRGAWTTATEAGLVRREVWAPTNRELARPDHAFRAAFQAHLAGQGVRDEVIDALVGHNGTLRAQHYVGATDRMEAMRMAVTTIPEVSWSGPDATRGETIRLAERGRTARSKGTS